MVTASTWRHRLPIVQAVTAASARPVARTAHLVLRRPAAADRDAFAALLTDPEVMRYVGNGRPLDTSGVARWMASATAAAPLGGIGVLAVLSAADDTVIGWCGLEIGEDTGRPEVTIALHPRFQGRGLGTEALSAVLAVADADADPDLAGVDLEATVDPDNTASRRLLARHGFLVVAEAPDVHGIPTLYCRRPRPDRPAGRG